MLDNNWLINGCITQFSLPCYQHLTDEPSLMTEMCDWNEARRRNMRYCRNEMRENNITEEQQEGIQQSLISMSERMRIMAQSSTKLKLDRGILAVYVSCPIHPSTWIDLKNMTTGKTLAVCSRRWGALLCERSGFLKCLQTNNVWCGECYLLHGSI